VGRFFIEDAGRSCFKKMTPESVDSVAPGIPTKHV